MLAWQTPGAAMYGTDSVTWEHRDASGQSVRATDVDGTLTTIEGKDGQELDPAGADAGMHAVLPPPISEPQETLLDYPSLGSPSRPGVTYIFDGMPIDADSAMQRMEAGSAAVEYLIHDRNGFRVERGGIISYGVGLFGIDTPYLKPDNEGGHVNWGIDVLAAHGEPQTDPQVDDGVVNYLRDGLEYLLKKPGCKKFVEDLVGTGKDLLGAFDKINSFVYTSKRFFDGTESSYAEGKIGGPNGAQIKFAMGFAGPFRNPLASAQAMAEMIRTTLHELIHLLGPNDSKAAKIVYEQGYAGPEKPPSLPDFLYNPKYKNKAEAINAFEMASSYYWGGRLRANCPIDAEEAVNLP